MRISPYLKSLLKVANKAHPKIHAMLVDLTAYKPKLIVKEERTAPLELGSEDQSQEDMKTAEEALQKPIHLPPKARFSPGPHIHVQFDGGA